MLQLLDLIKKLFLFTGYYSSGNYPKPLTAEEEKTALADHANGDTNAREKLICHNMRLVTHIAKKYHNSGDMDDLISIGSIGLIKGVESYSAEKSTTLATYLARCIENEILMTLRSNKRYKNTVFLNEQIGVDSDGQDYTLMDVLAVNEDTVFRQVELSVMLKRLKALIAKHLNAREQAIITLRYGLDDAVPLTQLQTAKKLGISRSYISRIETASIAKIRKHMSIEDSWL